MKNFGTCFIKNFIFEQNGGHLYLTSILTYSEPKKLKISDLLRIDFIDGFTDWNKRKPQKEKYYGFDSQAEKAAY